MNAQGATLSSIYKRLNPSNDAEKDRLELNVGSNEDDLRLRGKSSVFRTPTAQLSAVINTRYRVYEVLLSDVAERMGHSTPADTVDVQAHRIWNTNPTSKDHPITLRRVKELDQLVQGLEVSQPHSQPTAQFDSKQALVAPAAPAVSQGVVQQVASFLQPPTFPSQPRAKTKRVTNPAYPKESKVQPQSFQPPTSVSPQKPKTASSPSDALIKELQARVLVAGDPNSPALTSYRKRQE